MIFFFFVTSVGGFLWEVLIFFVKDGRFRNRGFLYGPWLPVYGAGLWGPIWGYVAVNSDGSSIYGAYFAHQGETPGLGAEIEKPAFSDQFTGLNLFKEGAFKPVNVIKAGQAPMNGEDYVDAISGGTITSKGVASMLDNCLSGYKTFLESLTNKGQ